jgi:hypothetical protein
LNGEHDEFCRSILIEFEPNLEFSTLGLYPPARALGVRLASKIDPVADEYRVCDEKDID